MKIDKNSYGTLAFVFFVGALIIWIAFRLIGIDWISWVLTGIVCFFCTWQLFFFRVPRRSPAGSHNVVSSAADGTVVIIDECYEGEHLMRNCKRVCVYMNFFDVHANFWPITGNVSYCKYHPGKHLLAFKPKASEENEHTSVALTSGDNEILFRQLAGTFARRIVCYAKMGIPVDAGKQCGIIKFGSRLDIYLPLDAKVEVKLGDKVKAAESVIARL